LAKRLVRREQERTNGEARTLRERLSRVDQTVFERLLVRDGRVAEARYLAPLDLLFNGKEFEYHDLVGGPGFEPGTVGL
jgi:hypothetical protein